ncbi:hypothetical protein J7E50_16585 [Pedobacter sp. ISL-68]|uniref:hypothetical protein n=1 Tax=unclassified Pedobacter TaxID=2628915 RepID=UPI001BE605DE|nr:MULTISPECIES: hypothetical protein [unclassified Pedobacter]MBT2564263.1 hypothetical protein [Pedobacter sp. ISL-64]MBT2591844.1 hypothetical protein [Pedobacter sp. ISL-68]
MIKKIKLSKKPFLAFIILITITAVIYSCKKSREASITELNTELLNESRTYFESIILKQIALNDNNIRHSIEKTPLWDKAFVKKISVGNAVIVPIKFDNDFRITNDDNTGYKRVTSYLIIYRDAKDVRHAEWVTLIPNITTQYASEKFIGTATIEDWSGNFIKAFAYGADGQIISVKLAESDIYKQVILRRLNCYTIHYYGHNYVEGVAGSDYWYENGSETYCQNESGVDYGPNGGDYGDMGSGGGGGTGGNGGEAVFEIKDSVQNDCIKAQLSHAQTAKTTIRNMLNDEFGTNNFNDRDIVFYDITTLPDTVAGTTHGNSAYSFIINLNENTLPQRSKEYILSTIYHEILHAYMDTQLGKDASGNYLISNQHQTMADKYVFLMMGALKVAFPNLSDRDAWALSWGGLEDTPFYKTKLSEAERVEIQNLMDKHRKSTAANLRHGTYCN